ncbi:MAG TPA: sugar transferase, partial [Acidimicrobiales bacterium]|nr:sugar transferase [Acidimicrobiales bacterium]
SGDDAARLTRMLVEEPELGYRVVGAVGTAAPDPLGCTLARVEDVAELPALARRTGASGVLIAGNATTVDGCNVVELAIGSGLHVQVWPGLGALSHRRVRLAPVARMPVLYVEPNPVARWQLVTKRVIDVVVAVALLPVVAPVLLVAALWIKLEDGGPIFHHHEVIGRFGAPMTVLKLRTMVPNAAEMLVDIAGLNERTGGPLFKATHDPRVTRVGRVLRATSIDELPQLFNVLAGSMSLIGPRFALPNEEAQFDEEHRRRHGMRPGITGLWQSEARDNPSFSAYRRLDLFYVDNWTLALDLAIAANTAHAVATRALRALGGRRRGSVSRPSPALGPDRAGHLP